jgi:hypothetical protein
MVLQIRLFVFMFFMMSSILHAGTIEIVTKFSKTGGIYGDLSHVGDKVNGRVICASENDNSNSVPGCDMSQDPGYNDNGTNDVSDDYYTGDLIVRTNDLIEVKVGWNATGVDNPIVLMSTLPSFNGENYLKWDSLPSSCAEGSSISEDGLTLTCIRTEDASISYSEDTPFYIKVKANTPNNTKTGEISFSIESEGLESKADGTDGYGLTVTAKPMWNIQKRHVETLEGETFNGEEGYIIRYAYLLEADEVAGEEETSSAVLGNEALGADFSLHFVDDVSQISPNAELVGCSVAGAEGSYEPYPWYHEDTPERSVGSLESDLSVSCVQSGKGGDITIDYTGIDATLNHVPTYYAYGGIIPKTRIPVASGVIDIFVPLEDIKNAQDIGNDSTELDTNNTFSSFDPISISGQSNFNSEEESVKDNSVVVPLIYRGEGYTSGSFHKFFAGDADSLIPLPDVTNGFYSADGILTPNSNFNSWLYFKNDGNKDFNETILCDVIDSNLYNVVDIEDDISAVKLYGNTAELNYTIEYATGYIGTWPPPLDENNEATVVNECKDSSVEWYSTTKEARDSGLPISKIRLVIPEGVSAGKIAGFIAKLEVRSEDLSGAVIPSGTNFVNYSAFHDNVLIGSDDNWAGATRILNSYPTAASGGSNRADRAVMMRAKVRSTKELSSAIVKPADRVNVHIESTFTTQSQSPERSDVKITEMLAPGLQYVMGSGNIGDPVVGSCDDIEELDPLKSVCSSDHQILIWDLGERTANEPIEDLEYQFVVSSLTPSGESSTYTIISSPTDMSHPNVRKANRNVSVTIPSSLFVTEEVNTPLREVDETPIEFTAYARNGSSETLSNIDIIDILPFNGDGNEGFFFTVGSTTIEKKRDLPSSFSGTLTLDSVSSAYACSSDVRWYYTKRDPKEIDIAPTASSNEDGGETVWCEGDNSGPADGCGFDNSEVTAVRLRGGELEADAICSLKILVTPEGNKKGDLYTNTSSTYAQGVSLPALSNDVTAFVPTTLLGDYVWFDTNANGIQDADEMGLEGISMELLDSGEGTLASTLSDRNGHYIFSELDVDTEYKIRATLPSYYRFTQDKVGEDERKDSDIAVENFAEDSSGITLVKTLNANQQYRDFDVGVISTLVISGKAYKQEDNSSIPGLTVTLYRDVNGDGLLDDNDTKMAVAVTTDNQEGYRFSNIPNGDYLVEISGSVDGYTLISDSLLMEQVEGSSKLEQNFKYNKIPESQNLSNDEILNTLGPVDIEDLTVIDDGEVDYFIIENLPESNSGTLYLADGTVVTEGMELTSEEAAGLQFDPNSGFMGNVRFDYSAVDNDGAHSLSAYVELSIYGNSSIGDLAWYDVNRNGIQDTGELAVEGIVLQLLDSNGAVIKDPSSKFTRDYVVTTDTNGAYIFEKLSDGDYSVQIINKNGYAISNIAQGEDVTQDSDFSIDNAKTVNLTLAIDEKNKDIDVGLYVPSISGHLYHDGDGNGVVDGFLTDKADDTQLYVTLVDSNGNALASKALSSDGNYSFNMEDGVKADADYRLLLSDELNSLTVKLPTGWVSENSNGQLLVHTQREDIENVDFGINKRPLAQSLVANLQLNPGKEVQVATAELNVTDEEDGVPTSIQITQLPSNAKLYYAGALVVENQILEDFNQSALLLDPNDGDVTVSFRYKSIDRAGALSDEATITMPFKGLKISGTIFDDGDANGAVNGEPISKPNEQQLYVLLLDSNEEILSSVEIVEGSYSFDNADGVIPDSNYTLVLTTEINNTEPKLPLNWNNADGEATSSGTLDEKADGIITVVVLEDNVENINFGINERPTSNDVSAETILNPGEDTAVMVPSLSIADREDGTPSIITITSLSSNARLYYNGALVVLNSDIENVNPSKFTVDPDDGDQEVLFTYTTKDKVGMRSDNATVTLSFTGLSLSGKLYDDGNGDEFINGLAFNNPSQTELFSTLLNENSEVLSSKALAEDGTYAFFGEDGIKPNTNYTVIISSQENATGSILPAGWSHDGEQMSEESRDEEVDGKVRVTVEESNVSAVNFGINQKPEAKDVVVATQVNPGGENSVIVANLLISDKEDGTPTTITITTIPTNAKLYYNGSELSVGDELSDFDASKFTIDPDNGDQTVVFNYTTTDRAGLVSNEAKVTLHFSDIELSGSVFDDGNNNGKVDGDVISKADETQLYVTLVNANGDAVASNPLAIDGRYSFSNVDGVIPNSTYTLVLSDEANKTSAELPENWNNADGESIANELDVKADGLLVVEVNGSNISELDFGINKQPVADDKTEATQFNPGFNEQVNVPTLSVSDKEDGIPAIVTIRSLADNATLYYDGVEITADMNITDLTRLSVDPEDGDQQVVFTYSATDRAGVNSNLATVTMEFKDIRIAGNIFNDGNADGVVNGTSISSPNGIQLYATLLDANGTVLATTAIAEDGTYLFSNKDAVLPNHLYTVVLSTTKGASQADLPINWNNADGEHIGRDAGLDDAPDGKIEVNLLEEDLLEVNFGINKKPVAGDNTAELQLNPGSDIQVDVVELNVSDTEDSIPSVVTIKTVPSNGTLYYNGLVVVVDQSFDDFNNSLLTLDPNNGTLTVSFTYTTTDESGVESEVATIVMPFKGLKISGNIFNDGNHDGMVNGEAISSIDEQALYTVLLDENGVLMAREAIAQDGSYTFDGLDGVAPNRSYLIRLSSDANSSIASLPLTWTYADGEHIGLDAGLDAKADGEIVVNVIGEDIESVNFGINARPIADNKYALERLQLSRENIYTVPTLSAYDREDGTPTTITIVTLPNHAQLYYDGNLVEVNATIADPSKLTIDPDDGDQNVTFTYTATDVTGAVSNPATVLMPFKGIKISGFVFADGNNDGTVNGTEIAFTDGTQLYATLLLNDNNETLSTVAIDSNGSYMFENRDGVYPNNNYHVVLSTEANATTATLLENWNHADGEHIGRDRGLDDKADGMIDVSVETIDIVDVNFGINKRPVVLDVQAPLQANPGGEKQVSVIDLNISDNEDGSPKTVTIVTLPTDGTLYYNGVPVTEGEVIPNFDNKLLTVDPKNGATNITFEYTTTDNTGWESEKATAVMPFAAVAPTEDFTVVDDKEPASLKGPVTTIPVLENDNGLGEGSVIHLLNTNNGTILWNDGTAVGSASIETEDTIVVQGEGVWTVEGDNVVFTAEEGYTGIPAPIYYVVEDTQGNQTNVAQIAIISNCVCDTYEKSVSAMNPWSMLLILLFISTLGAFFAQREFESIE